MCCYLYFYKLWCIIFLCTMYRHICIPVDRLFSHFMYPFICLSLCKTPRNIEWIFMKIDTGKFITNIH